MMWWNPSWVKLAPVLLAASLRTPRDLVEQYQATYRRLESHEDHTVARVHHASPTLRFVHQLPNENGDGGGDDENKREGTNKRKKPVAVYLPGLDGFGISAVAQMDDLASTFELWRLTIDRSDRSSFAETVAAIANFLAKADSDIFLQDNDDTDQQQHMTLIGESTGGLLAAAVALQLQQRQASTNNRHRTISGLVLVNPATSFGETTWDRTVPLLTSLLPNNSNNNRNHDAPSSTDDVSPYAVLGSLLLASIVPDTQQTRRILDTFRQLPDLDLRATPDVLRQGFQTTEQTLPAAMLEHRVKQWLTVGTPLVNARLPEFNNNHTPTLVIAGAQDRLLPSRQEAERWQVLLGAETLVVPDRGHFVLDDSVNLTEAILYSKIDPLGIQKHSKPYDPITDWTLSESETRQYIQQGPVKTFRDLFSPVYFSTDAVTGKRWKGLGKVPASASTSILNNNDNNNNNNDKRRPPLLFVGNHQFAALDLQLLVADLWQERGIFMRGLAHPVTFTASQNLNFRDLGGRRPGLNSNNGDNNNDGGGFGPGNFEKFGAVRVTPRNYYRLLQTGQDALLFPGGAKEALTGNKSYPLYWPEDKVDFVRTAARFNATIVPVSAVGMVDSVNVLAEPQDLLDLPVIGDRLRQQQANLTAARYDAKPEDEIVSFPIAVPKLPARNYILFGKPIDTSCVDPNDKDTCERVYRVSRDEVQRGIDDLLQAREQDPFQDTPKRWFYERIWGKRAPTFPIDAINKK